MAALAKDADRVISATIQTSAASFAARLTAKADVLAQVAAENIRRERALDPWRWRRPQLLWPLFAASFRKGR